MSAILRFLTTFPAIAVAPLSATAQSTISAGSTSRSAVAANAGWIDFRPSAPDGVVVTETYLKGSAYGANIGWITLGAGSPVNRHTYQNNSAGDYGVNVSPEGRLSGYAYGANIGWIVFEQTYGFPRINYATGQIVGYAYSANIGWISFATGSTSVVTSTISYEDTDGDGIADAWEYQKFGSLSVAGATSDRDGDGVSDLREYLANTNPLDPADHLRIISLSVAPGLASSTLTFTSNLGRRYRIETDDDLTAPWTITGIGAFSPDSGTTTTRSVSHPASARNFFRVVALRPLQP